LQIQIYAHYYRATARVMSVLPVARRALMRSTGYINLHFITYVGCGFLESSLTTEGIIQLILR